METISSEIIHQHPYFTAKKEAYKTDNGKIVDPYFFVDLPTCVVGFALTTKDEVLMIKQYRHPIGRTMLELPGGFIDANEDPLTAIQRELKEETGYQFKTIQYLGATAANPGVLNNFTHMFLLTDGEKVAEQSLDANEEIDIVLVPMEELKKMVFQHEIVQSMHALTCFYALKHLNLLG